MKIRSAVWPTKAAIKNIYKKHRQNTKWTHRWACVHKNKQKTRIWHVPAKHANRMDARAHSSTVAECAPRFYDAWNSWFCRPKFTKHMLSNHDHVLNRFVLELQYPTAFERESSKICKTPTFFGPPCGLGNTSQEPKYWVSAHSLGLPWVKVSRTYVQQLQRYRLKTAI